MTPQQLKSAVPRGMLSFPLTDFDANDAFDAKACVRRLEWLSHYPSSALFMAGDDGRFPTADLHGGSDHGAELGRREREELAGAAGHEQRG